MGRQRRSAGKDGRREGDTPHRRAAPDLLSAAAAVNAVDDHLAEFAPPLRYTHLSADRPDRDERLLSRFLMHRLSELILSFKSGSAKAVSAGKPFFYNARRPRKGLQQAIFLLYPKAK